MLDWIVEGLRWIIWGLTSATLRLMDVCYGLVQDIASADFLRSSEVWGWYYFFMGFLSILVVVRMLAMFFKFSFDEEFRDKINGTHIINKLLTIALVIGLLPTILGFVSQVSLYAIQNVDMVVGTGASQEPSSFVITSFMNTDNGEFDENGNWVEGEKITYTIDDVDINEDGEGEEDYKFFNDISDLFIVSILGIASSIMLIINGIQIGKRMFSLVMKVIIAPIPISSIIVPGDETFTMWRKMIVSDYLLNYFQTLMIMIVMILCGSQIVQQLGVWVQIILFISGLLLLLSGVPELAKILGGDTSQAGILQQFASFRLATRGVGNAIGSGAKRVGGTMLTGGAMATYGAGRALGGQSIKNMQKNAENGFMGGNTVNDKKQTVSSLNLHNDGGNVENNIGNKMDSNGNTHTVGQTKTSQDVPYMHHSQEGTRARAFSERANTKTGLTGAGARFAVNGSKHVYQASMQRVQNSKIYRVGNNINHLTKRTDR